MFCNKLIAFDSQVGNILAIKVSAVGSDPLFMITKGNGWRRCTKVYRYINDIATHAATPMALCHHPNQNQN